uniref:Ribosomal protein S9 n=1 Tax=Spumella sp. NIES-1846 TaxID=2490549 RepID=A0A455RF23_9STRA|nr:ribosomal protein S9 [Spumella sp. NIES-1846]
MLKPVIAPSYKFYYTYSKRKSSKIHLYLKQGKGIILINNKSFFTYFNTINTSLKNILLPLKLLKLNNYYDIFINSKGGGINSQINAINLALAKILFKINRLNRLILKPYLLLRSDSRIKERRKYGLKKARKAVQYSKR